MPAIDPRIDAYIERSAEFARPILLHLRKLIHAACPDVAETIKWGVPFYEYHGIICGTAAFKAHCNLVFWKSKMIGAPSPRKSVDGEESFGSIKSLKDLPGDALLKEWIKKSAEINKAGVKGPSAMKPAGIAAKAKTAKVKTAKDGASRSAKAAKPIEIPAELSAALALKKNKMAAAAFAAMPPSHRKEYAQWIAGAKQEATRERRVAKAIEQLGAGKSLNWKYEKPKSE